MGVLRNLAPRRVFSARTRLGLKLDLLRLRARVLHHGRRHPPASDHLHLGCGDRRVPRWLNVDLVRSDFDLDLACGELPWPDDVFDVVVSQQVVEHLDVLHELLPLLREVHRVSRPGAELWLACPDLAKVCRAYVEDRGRGLLRDRLTRWPEFSLRGLPAQHMVNELFHQGGQHKNLFDFEYLQWLLEQVGFGDCVRHLEADLLARFPEFPRRDDDFHSVYASARNAKSG